MTQDERIEQLEAEVEGLWGHVLGMTALFSALLKTHPQYDQLQLVLTGDLEWLLNRPPAQALTAQQREAARTYVESLQALGRAQPPE